MRNKQAAALPTGGASPQPELRERIDNIVRAVAFRLLNDLNLRVFDNFMEQYSAGMDALFAKAEAPAAAGLREQIERLLRIRLVKDYENGELVGFHSERVLPDHEEATGLIDIDAVLDLLRAADPRVTPEEPT
jgi:hypothetical protein